MGGDLPLFSRGLAPVPGASGAVFLFLLIGAALLPGCQSERPPGDTAEATGPRISFSEPTHDFGIVLQGSTLVHVFKVKNTGDEPLKLIRAKGS